MKKPVRRREETCDSCTYQTHNWNLVLWFPTGAFLLYIFAVIEFINYPLGFITKERKWQAYGCEK